MLNCLNRNHNYSTFHPTETSDALCDAVENSNLLVLIVWYRLSQTVWKKLSPVLFFRSFSYLYGFDNIITSLWVQLVRSLFLCRERLIDMQEFERSVHLHREQRQNDLMSLKFHQNNSPLNWYKPYETKIKQEKDLQFALPDVLQWVNKSARKQLLDGWIDKGDMDQS